jgi:hypothetical protein
VEIGILMGLLGLGLVFGMGGSSDTDEQTASDMPVENPDDTEDPTVAPAEPANQFVYDGSPTLIGTDGDDTLVYLDFTPENTTLMTQTEVIDGGLGDDYIEAGFFLNDSGPATSGLVVNGGDGDDTLSSTGIGSEFNGGDGNDLIDVSANDTVNGGTGNDTISSAGGAEVDGGTGDDVLTGEHGDTLFGGAGNDVLSEASSMSGGDGNDTISGGYELSGGDGDDLLTSYANPYAAGDGDAIGMSGDAGNDTLTASADIGYDNTPSVPGSYLGMSGGEGADVFDVQITMPSNISTANSLEDIERDTFLNIVDFDPDQDVLAVQINGNEGNANYEMTWAEIVQRDFADESSSEPMLERVVQMNFAATETTGTFTTWFRLPSELYFPITEIEFVAGPGVTIRDDVVVLPTDGTSVVFDPDDNFADPLIVYSDDVEYWEIGSLSLSDGDDYADIQYYNAGVYGEMGDDTITTHDSHSSISGGEGDDLITALGGESGLNGGEGNDTIDGLDSDGISGGAGDDVINVKIQGAQRVFGYADGGEGDDTISLTAEIGDDGAYGSIVSPIFGGEGVDAFDVQLNLSDTSYNDDDLDTSDSGTILELSDFDANEDSLVIQINRGDGNEDREMASAEIISNKIVMTFAATDTFGEHTTAIRLGSDVNITLDDIVFVQN